MRCHYYSHCTPREKHCITGDMTFSCRHGIQEMELFVRTFSRTYHVTKYTPFYHVSCFDIIFTFSSCFCVHVSFQYLESSTSRVSWETSFISSLVVMDFLVPNSSFVSTFSITASVSSSPSHCSEYVTETTFSGFCRKTFVLFITIFTCQLVSWRHFDNVVLSGNTWQMTPLVNTRRDLSLPWSIFSVVIHDKNDSKATFSHSPLFFTHEWTSLTKVVSGQETCPVVCLWIPFLVSFPWKRMSQNPFLE